MHHRPLLPLLALAAAACARDLALDPSAPPRVDSVQVAYLTGAPPSPLPVLGGELVTVRGSGFPADAAQLEVRMGSGIAEVVEVGEGRLVARVPSLQALGEADLKVTTAAGFVTVPGALRYDGPGQPPGLASADLSTSVGLGAVAPVQPPRATGFSSLAIATGASDAALLVVPASGVAATSIPLGLVPVTAAARALAVPGGYRIEVLALGRGGEVALGSAVLDASSSLVTRVAAKPLQSGVTQRACAVPRVLFTNDATTPVAAWENAAGARIAAIDPAQIASGQYVARGAPRNLPAPVSGWAPWGASSVVVGAGTELLAFDAVSATTPATLTVRPRGLGLPRAVADLLAAECGGSPLQQIHSVAVASSGGSDALAVSYRAGDLDLVGLVELAASDPASAGTVHVGLAATVPTSVALVPDPPFATSAQRWSVMVGGISSLHRFAVVPGAPSCRNLVPDAALVLSERAAGWPAVGGLLPAEDGTRLLSITPDGDLVTVLPPSLTSAGPVLRLAAYGGVTVQRATIGGVEVPIAVAEHATTASDLSSIDTGSALLVASLSGDGGSVALGGSGYGRGAVWLDPTGTGTTGALAYSGDLPGLGGGASARAGAAAVTAIGPGRCVGEAVRVSESRPVANGPDLVVQGPARSGALGPVGVARFGPASPPVYTVVDSDLLVYGPGKAGCLAGGSPFDPLDWSSCDPDAKVALGVEPLDVTLSAGDRAVAVRSLEPDAGACGSSALFPAACAAADKLCRRSQCPPAKQLVVRAAGAGDPVTLALPGRPAGVAADPGGGFLVTVPCTSVAPSGRCFPASPLCAALLTTGASDGALLHVSEDAARVSCLAVLPGLGGPVAVTPNGAQAWVTGPALGVQLLSRLDLPRRAADGAIDGTRLAIRSGAEALGLPAAVTGSAPPGGVAFVPDGSQGIVTVPGEFRIVLRQ